jgi:hypothetical protein
MARQQWAQKECWQGSDTRNTRLVRQYEQLPVGWFRSACSTAAIMFFYSVCFSKAAVLFLSFAGVRAGGLPDVNLEGALDLEADGVLESGVSY